MQPTVPKPGRDAESAPTVDVDELREWLTRGDPVTVLDVRRAAARAEWAIPGSLHVDAYDELRAGGVGALSSVRLPASAPVVTVCNMGNTSRIAARELRARGVEAFSLAGGMRAWSLAWNSAEVPLEGSAAVVQVRRTGKGCLSYVVGSGGAAAVVDAALAPEVYLDLARARGWRVTVVLETHVHADHLSRAHALVERTGAALRLPEQRRVKFAFDAVADGDLVEVGEARLVAFRLPGHTAESTAYLLDGRALFTGDTLFLDGVGRPDLKAEPEEVRPRARALYRSLRRVLDLPPETLVLPGHTSHPVAFDGRPLVATLGDVREGVELLAASEAVFVETILARIPETPPNHSRIVELNEAGALPEDPAELEAGANRCAVR